jgi:hypothetical protein
MVDYQEATDVGAKRLGSPLESALGVHAEQLSKLNELIDTLSIRLNAVRNSHPTENDRADDPEPSASPVVRQLMGHTKAVKVLQERLGTLLNDLEV